MDFGHGFVPRLDARTAAAVDRAVGSPGQPTLDGARLALPVVIADASWAVGKPPLLAHLRDSGSQVLVDSQAWRYREPATFTVDKYRRAPTAPLAPLTVDDEASLREFVLRDLEHQHRCGATALVVPGFVPRHVGDDPTPMTRIAVETALGCTDLPAMPLVAFVGGHTLALDRLVDLVGQLHHGLSALYVQLTPVHPLHDSTAKLVAVIDALRACEGERFPVIAGHMGGITPLLRTFGISAGDAGLAQNECFAISDKRRPPAARRDRQGTGWAGPRIFVRQLGRSVVARVWRELLQVPEVRGRIRCTELCCRFRTLDTTITRSVEHSLHGRVADAVDADAVPVSLRIDRMTHVLEQQRSLIAMGNAALVDLGEPPFDGSFVDHHLDTMARLRGLVHRSA